MKINTFNQPQNNISKKNAPSFQAKLVVPDDVAKSMEADLLAFYNRCAPIVKERSFGGKFDFKAILGKFTTLFEKTTECISGEVEITEVQSVPNWYNCSYKTQAGEIFRPNHPVSGLCSFDLLPTIFGETEPKGGVRLAVGHISDVMGSVGCKGEANPFSVLSCKLIREKFCYPKETQ